MAFHQMFDLPSEPISIGVFPREHSDSGWFAILDGVPPANKLNGSESVDWLIIGGGWMGLHATQRLAELRPNDRIALVDAGRIGNNTGGRCAGFAIDLAHNPRKENFAEDTEGNREEAKINRGGIAYMEELVDRLGLDCDWSPEGKIHGAVGNRGRACLASFAAALDKIGEPYEWYDAARMREVVGNGYFSQGLLTPGTVLMQPAAYLRRLADRLPDNVSLFENSPIVKVCYGAPTHLFETSESSFRAKNVILANNGFLTNFGFYAGTAIPVCTFGSLTRPLAEHEQKLIGGRGAYGLIPAESFGTTMRRTADNRIFIRNVYDYARDFEVTSNMIERARRRHQETFNDRYPEIAGIGFEHSWGGGFCLAQNGGMVFGQLAENIFGVAFCNGTGVARGTAFGKSIAELACGYNNEAIGTLQRRASPTKAYPRFITEPGVRLTTRYRLWHAGKEV